MRENNQTTLSCGMTSIIKLIENQITENRPLFSYPSPRQLQADTHFNLFF